MLGGDVARGTNGDNPKQQKLDGGPDDKLCTVRQPEFEQRPKTCAGCIENDIDHSSKLSNKPSTSFSSTMCVW